MNDLLPINESILDLCINAIYDQGKTVDDCLAMYPESKAVEPVLRLAEQLQSARHLTAPTDFRLSARDRLEKRLTAHPRTFQEPGHLWPLEKRPQAGSLPSRRTIPAPRHAAQRSTWVYAIGLTMIVIALMVSSTTAYASNALPGDPLYQVKITSEKLQLVLAPTEAQDASLHLKFADERFREMQALIEKEQTSHLSEAVQSYQEEINSVNYYFTSKQMSEQDKTRVLRQLSQQMVDHNQQLSSLITELRKAHPAVSAETAILIQSETKTAVDFMHQMFPQLLDRIRDNQDLMKEFQGFPGMETPTQPAVYERTETPAPTTTFTIFLQTPVPGVNNPEEGETEWPTPVTTARPTQWITNWATLFPDTTLTPPSYLIQTIYPTYLPTYLPTYFPTDDGGNDPGEAFPGWNWPTDFPDDNDQEPPPNWAPTEAPVPPPADQNPLPDVQPTAAPGNEEPPGWEWPTDFPDDGDDGPPADWGWPTDFPDDGEDEPPPGWVWP